MAVSILSSLLRKGLLRQVFLLAGGIFLTLQVLAPLARGELSQFGQYLAGLEIRKDAITSGIEVENQEILAQIIREKTEAYIWDKAVGLGMDCAVRVQLSRAESGIPVPESVSIGTAYHPILAVWIEEVVGIPAEKQIWLEESA